MTGSVDIKRIHDLRTSITLGQLIIDECSIKVAGNSHKFSIENLQVMSLNL